MTQLVIPPQLGGPTSWEVTDYSSLPTDLLILGLIHTHPGFQSFMSSIDLHALHVYDIINSVKEIPLISIVLALEENHAPLFQLTDFGRSILTRCSSNGHHEHR